MTLPDFHDSRPYTHPDLPGTWRLSTIGPNTIHLRREGDNLITTEQIADWPGEWVATHGPPAPRVVGGDIAIDVSAHPGNVTIRLPTGDVVLIPHASWREAARTLPNVTPAQWNATDWEPR